MKITKLVSLPRSLVVLTALTALMSGCATYKSIDEAPRIAEEAFNMAVDQAQSQRQNPITMLDEPWAKIRRAAPAPVQQSKLPIERDCKITLIVDAPITLQDFAQMVTADCRLPVRVSQDVWVAGRAPMVGTDRGFNPAGAMPGMVPPLESHNRMPTHHYASANGEEKHIQPMRWLGKPVSSLLDVVTSQLGISWSYRSGSIVLHYLDTRTYDIALSSELDYESNVSSGASLSTGSSGGGAGGTTTNETTNESAQRTSLMIKSRFTADLQSAVESMLTPGIGQLALSSSIGTLTVTDTPDVLDKVGSYIDNINARMKQQAMLHVTVASVTLTDTKSQGINWNAVWRSASGAVGLGLSNSFSPMEDTGSASFGILDTARGRAGRFAGTQAILSALSRQGSVSIMRERGVTTQHLQPTPIHLTNERQYVCGRSQTNTSDVGSTESIQMCSVVTGFAMDILPDINGDELTLQFSLNMSPPATIDQVPGETDKPVFAASVDRQVFLQRVGMRSGQTLVISDFQEAQDTAGKQGIGSTRAWALTGGGSREQQRRVLVIIISPRVMPSHSQGV